MDRIKTSAGKNKYRWDYQELRYLVHILQQSKDFPTTLNLFLDLHTQKEISEIIRRILIASMVLNGDTYEDIHTVTGASTGTIARISQKMLRPKSVLQASIDRAGSYSRFSQTKAGDAVQRRIDRLLAKIGLSK